MGCSFTHACTHEPCELTCMKVAHGQWGVALDKHLVGALGSLVKVVVAAAANAAQTHNTKTQMDKRKKEGEKEKKREGGG